MSFGTTRHAPFDLFLHDNRAAGRRQQTRGSNKKTVKLDGTETNQLFVASKESDWRPGRRRPANHRRHTAATVVATGRARKHG